MITADIVSNDFAWSIGYAGLLQIDKLIASSQI